MQDAMYELYRAYYEDLYRFVIQLEAGRGDADALVQEVLMAADRHLPQYRGECGYKAWLFAVAYQHLNSPWRRLLRGRKGQAEQPDEVLPADLDEEERERRQLLQALRDLFAEMPRRERDVLVLLELHEFSVRDAGIILTVMDEKVRALTERALEKVKDRFPQSEQYHRALRLMREVPAEQELRGRKAAAWEAFEAGARQGKRRAKLRPVIWGAVGVAVLAVGVLGWRQFDGSETAEQATTAPAQLQPVQTSIQDGGQSDVFGMKRVDLSHVYSPYNDPPKTKNVLFLENRVFQIEEPNGSKTQLLALENILDEFHMMDIQSPYVVFTIRTSNGEHRAYRVNVEKKMLDEIPLENQNLVTLRVWPGAHGVALLMVSQQTNVQKAVVYDWDSGEATTVMENEAQLYNRLDARGDHLVLSSEQLIAVKTPDGPLQQVVKAQAPTLRYLRMTNDYVLYMDGTDGTLSTNRENAGTARVKKYDMRTGKATDVLPGVEGEQWLLNEYTSWSGNEDEYGVFVGLFQPTETVDDGSGQPPVQKGVQQIWRVLPNGERTKLYEETVDWGMHGFQMAPRNPESDMFVIHHNHPELPPLMYSIKTGAVTLMQN